MTTGATELLTVVQQLRSSAEVQNEGVSRQAAALRQAEATITEIRQTSQLAAEKAQQVANASSEADAAGREGARALEGTLAGLEVIHSEVAEMSSRIQALEERNREIAGIVETVKGLADQSNMLALNAAIEAVRSGEHGKGFAVVAREVRTLADQSIEATRRIREILDSVGENMRATAEMSRSGERRVRSSVDEVRASGEQLAKLALIVSETGGSVRQITMAVAQQDAGTHQIATAVADLSVQMEKTLRAVQDTEAVSRAVQKLAEGMSTVAAAAVTPAEAAPAPSAPSVQPALR
jgi:methyl-accepting chemotaxis protein